MDNFFYIQSNQDWIHKYKYGITSNPKNRINSDQHSYKTFYKKLFKYNLTDDYRLNYNQIDKIISIISRNKDYINQLIEEFNFNFKNLIHIHKYLVNTGGGTEFIYKDGLELLELIIKEDFKILGINIQEIDVNDINNYIVNYDCKSDYKINKDLFKFKKEREIEFIFRDYQIEIINKGFEIIKKESKLYLELATGAGKSYIAYSIFNLINPKIIIILTPRINICEQNIQNKYKSLLKNPDINIICKCTQSFKKVYSIIKNENLNDVLLWFDEAHWGLDNWTNDKIKDFLLFDNIYIKYRLFTSASPNKEHIYKFKNIYGNIYSPIKVSKLMNEDWLCKLNTYIYKEKYNLNSYKSIINYSLWKFNDLKKTLGMSFNNSCENAIERFLYHYELFKNSQTNIKPFLLLNDETIKKFKKNYSNIPINLFDINQFKENSFAYVVGMYSMGYDNNKIDYLIFNDPKLSVKDIIQCIGRGTRSDGFGKGGKNQKKETDIILPVYIDDKDNANAYEKIKEVIKYLVIDLELELNRIIIENKYNSNKNKIEFEKKKEKEDKIIDAEIETIIYDIHNNNKEWTIKKLEIQLLYNNIHNLASYENYKNNNIHLKLPEKLFITFPEFDFTNTYRINENPYYNRNECIEAIKKCKNLLLYEDEIITILELILFLHQNDNKIPNECLWYYYGGSKDDFIIFDKFK